MSSASRRRKLIQRLIEDRFGGRMTDFARSIDRSPAQVWQIMNQTDRQIGERLARHIEDRLGLPSGDLDGMAGLPAALAQDEAELLRHYRRAVPSWKDLVREVAGVAPREQQAALSRVLLAAVRSIEATSRSSESSSRDSKTVSRRGLARAAARRKSKK